MFKWTLLWTLVLVILTFMPGHALPANKFTIPYLDKVVHFGFYFTFILLYEIESYHQSSHTPMLLGVGLATLLGVSTEFGQRYLTGGRHFEFFDILANISGTFMGWLIFRFILKKL